MSADPSSFHALLQGENGSFPHVGDEFFIHGKAAQKGLRRVREGWDGGGTVLRQIVVAERKDWGIHA